MISIVRAGVFDEDLRSALNSNFAEATSNNTARVAADAVLTAAIVTAQAAAQAASVAGVAASYKLARGVHQQVAASDTVVTGLATVVAVVVSWRDTPTVKQMFLTATIGDQAGAPAAGSFLGKTFKPTATDNVTPTAATDFTENLSWNWVAIGT